ncbi:hypothetical protein K469DRAFT_711032 [Zopfia rhizophila CBS 207.26]|uniref:Uncharacterized protein n=1 Tax=Zopfia rhizophila CBS 207.26 TaxID=1314779 RepID=A0A6A6DTT6_9PEZI|nr:hypothetical protein K469DRAFT_711032 [Zopfia rhizophila CBS 207.26]
MRVPSFIARTAIRDPVKPESATSQPAGRILERLHLNHQYTINWNSWDGRPWRLVEVSTSFSEKIRLINRYKLALASAQERLRTQNDGRSQLDTFVVARWKAIVDVEYSILPFWRTLYQLKLSGFLIQTASDNVHARFGWFHAATASLTLDISRLLQSLRNLRLQKATKGYCLFSFQHGVRRLKIVENFLEEKRTIAAQQKSFRLQYKLENGRRGFEIAHTGVLQDEYGKFKQRRNRLYRVKNLDRSLFNLFDKDPKLWVAEGFFGPMIIIQKRGIMALQTFRDRIKFLYFRDYHAHGLPNSLFAQFHTSRLRIWKRLSSLREKILDLIKETLELNAELYELRLFRVRNSLADELKGEIEEGRAFYADMLQIIEDDYRRSLGQPKGVEVFKHNIKDLVLRSSTDESTKMSLRSRRELKTAKKGPEHNPNDIVALLREAGY